MSDEKEVEKIDNVESKNVTEVKGNNSKNKILIGIIAALSLIIVILLVILLNKDNGGDGDKDNGAATAEATSENGDTNASSEFENTTLDGSTEQGDEQNDSAAGDEPIVVTLVNQWEGSGKFFGQIDITYNNTGNDIKGWKVIIDVPDGMEVDSGWNCNYKIENGKLIVTNVDYNETITKNSQLKDVGIILTAKSKEDIEALSNSKAVFDGIVTDENTETNISSETTDENTEQTAQKPEVTTGNEGQVTEHPETTTEKPNTVTEKTETTTEKTEAATEEPPKTTESKPHTESGTPYGNHGKLSVKGVDLVDASGKKYQLKGVSTHGIAWFPDYVNKDAIKTLRDDWGANLFRIAMYSGEYNGYCTGGDKDSLKNLVVKGVDAATDLGMYVIIDWHVLGDQNPLTYKDEAKKFFSEMSKKYKNHGNVIYEICNEPNGGTSWADVKSYANEIIPVIKKNNPDAVIIVGTTTWSQDVDQAAADPLTGYTNIMYAAHFYAATHTDWLRDRISAARNSGIPIFISEFSICDASGNGAIDYNQSKEWFKLMNDLNLSYATWSLCNKAETSALISSSCTKTSGWKESDLSETGKWLRKQIRGK